MALSWRLLFALADREFWAVPEEHVELYKPGSAAP